MGPDGSLQLMLAACGGAGQLTPGCSWAAEQRQGRTDSQSTERVNRCNRFKLLFCDNLPVGKPISFTVPHLHIHKFRMKLVSGLAGLL